MQIKYSFIIPVYDVEAYLRHCVDSILAQTYRSFEIIIIDDEAMDDSGKIAEEYAERFPEFVRVIHQKNSGSGGARNHGISVARGEYILFVDGDDFVVPNMLEIIEKYRENHEFDLLLFSHIRLRDKNIKKEEPCAFLDDYQDLSLKEYVCQQPAVWKKVYRASLFEHEDLRFITKIFYQDLAISPEFAMYAKNVGIIKEPLYYYVLRRGSAMHCKKTDRFFEIFKSFDYVMSCFRNQNMVDEYYAELEWLAIQHVLYFSTFRVLRVGYDPDAISKFANYVKEMFPNYRENKYIECDHDEVDKGALKLLLNDEFLALDKKYCRKKRNVQKIKDLIWGLKRK